MAEFWQTGRCGPRVHRVALTVMAITFVFGPVAVQAEPLAEPACTKLETEHQALRDTNIAQDIARGPEWGEKNLGQHRLQQIKRLLEIEEQFAFRCRGRALTSAVMMPDLRTVKEKRQPVNVVKIGRTPTGAVRLSRVPLPVRRPALETKAAVEPANTTPSVPRTATAPAQAETPSSSSVVNHTPAKVSPAAARPTISPTKRAAAPANPASPVDSGPTEDKPKLPKVIRLQPQKAQAKPTSKARQVRAQRRRKRKKRPDTYVPPPPNPSYQPSLTSP